MTKDILLSMSKKLTYLLLLLFAVLTLASCDSSGRSNGNKMTEEDYRRMDSINRAYRHWEDSIKEVRKKEHDEYIRKMARDIVDSGSKGRKYKEPTDGKQMYEDAMVGFDRYEDVDDNDDMRGFMEDND